MEKSEDMDGIGEILRNVKLQSEFKWPKEALNILANTLSLQDSYDVNYMYNQIIRVIMTLNGECTLLLSDAT